MTTVRRTRRTAPPPAVTNIPQPPPHKQPAPIVPPPRRVIPIVPGYNAPAPDDGSSGPKVDYKAVIARYKSKVTNRASAIRAMCIECSGGVISEVRNCAVTKCSLYPFRNNEDPFRKKRTGFATKNDEGDEE